MKSVVPRERARRDIDDAIDHDLEEAGETVALRFVDALEGAFRHIADHPASGPARCVFERADYIDVWRVLRGKRDIASWLPHEDERPLRES